MQKKNAPTSNASESAQTQPDSTTSTRPLYWPLNVEPARFRGKTKRATKRDAISRKRGEK